jgi:hypothetical protein
MVRSRTRAGALDAASAELEAAGSAVEEGTKQEMEVPGWPTWCTARMSPVTGLSCSVARAATAPSRPAGDITGDLHHFMVELEDIDDVGRAYDPVDKEGIERGGGQAFAGAFYDFVLGVLSWFAAVR